jgi:predicted secreted protein
MGASIGVAGFGTLLKIGDGGVGAGVQSFKTWGSANTSIRLKAKLAGVAGNGRSITVLSSGASYVKTVLTASAISITIPTTATVAQVIAWLYTDATFQANWDADYNAVGDGSGVCPAQTVTTTAGGSDGTEVFTTIAEIQSVDFSGVSQQYVDVTHMESTSGFREQIPTFKDPGTVDVSLSYVPANTIQKGIITDHLANTLRNFRCYMPDGTFWGFAAYIASFSFNAPFDGKLSAKLQLKIKGAPTTP